MATKVSVLNVLGMRSRLVTALENAGLATVEEVSAAFEGGNLGSYSGIGPATVAEVELALLCWPDYLAAQEKVDALKDAIHGAGRIPAGAADAREEARASLDAGDLNKAAFWAEQGLELFEIEEPDQNFDVVDAAVESKEAMAAHQVEVIEPEAVEEARWEDAVSAYHRGAGIIAVPNALLKPPLFLDWMTYQALYINR